MHTGSRRYIFLHAARSNEWEWTALSAVLLTVILHVMGVGSWAQFWAAGGVPCCCDVLLQVVGGSRQVAACNVALRA
jgi:hypothetical protein